MGCLSLCGGRVTIGCLSLSMGSMSQLDACLSLWWACHNRMFVSLCGGCVTIGCLFFSVVGVSQ